MKEIKLIGGKNPGHLLGTNHPKIPITNKWTPINK
jgi:hypothetical protein